MLPRQIPPRCRPQAHLPRAQAAPGEEGRRRWRWGLLRRRRSGDDGATGERCGRAREPRAGAEEEVGCIESATQMGRKKRLQSEYVLGGEIEQGKFGSVRICRAKAGGEEFACKALPKNGEETVHREDEKELVENTCCPVHLKPCVRRKEDNYLFALSKYQNKLEELLIRNPNFVRHSYRLNEGTSGSMAGLHGSEGNSNYRDGSGTYGDANETDLG